MTIIDTSKLFSLDGKIALVTDRFRGVEKTIAEGFMAQIYLRVRPMPVTRRQMS
jgi:hypothetical protein